ncbi:MAG TPA: NfeD family protein [Candidatus Kapabacteria bacterium]|nr:NfeD family protein [Candidatus Kapabacteria bacterium]
MIRIYCVILLFLTVSAANSFSQNSVLVINITGEVDPAMSAYVDRAVSQAEESHSAILLHVNTFGGRLDVATHIRDAIINAKVPMTAAFIDKRAISAGALITLTAKKIIMSPGSTFGAATPIYETGEKASEKVVSYMRAEMRSTAELNHRNPDVAAAMVDEQLGLDSVSGIKLEKGKLLTLTNESAKQTGYIDGEASTIANALILCGYANVSYTESKQTFSDEVIRLLTLPLVSSILIMIGLAGIFYTIKTGHFGAITLAGLAALILFFSAQYITTIAPAIALILFLVGIFLFFIELTPVPTFGLGAVFGVGGIILGLFLALAGDLKTLTPDRLRVTAETLAASLVGVIAAIFIIVRYAPGWPMLQKFVHQTVSSQATAVSEDHKALVGKHGTSITPLRPSGTALIDNSRVDVVTRGEFVMPGSDIEVIETVANKIVVRKV